MGVWKQADAISRTQLMAMFGETPETILRPGLSHEEFEVGFKKANQEFPPEELEKSWLTYQALRKDDILDSEQGI